jgi:Protein of Unknown function (DUF2784)
MLHAWLATAVLVLHAAFLGYLCLGGFLAWRWPRTIAAHVVVVAWGIGSVLVGYGCPLTALEDSARRRAGQAGLAPGGFIEEYLTGVVYPERYLLLAQCAVGVLVVTSWVGWWRRRVGRRTASVREVPDRRVSPGGRARPPRDRAARPPRRRG